MTFVTRSCIAKLPSFSHLSTRKAAVSDEAQSNKNGFFFSHCYTAKHFTKFIPSHKYRRKDQGEL